MKKQFIILICFILMAGTSSGQVFKIQLNQPDPLQISTGNDTTMCKNNSVVLGSNPTAYGGNGEYFYSWSPADGLDDPTSPNPVATPSQSTKYVLTVSDGNFCQVSESINIIVDLCLGLDEGIQLSELSIFPNPGTGSFTVSGLPSDGSGTRIVILNSIGTEIMTEFIPAGTPDISIDLTGRMLPKGVYFFRIHTSKMVLTKRVQLI